MDLHSHSTVSDGTDAPEVVVQKAKAAGLRVLALTDHDTFDGLAAAGAAAEAEGIELVPGMEMSCELGGRSVHLLAYGVDRANAALDAELRKVRAGRDDRMPRMIARLGELGMPLTEAEVMVHVGEAPSIGRPHIADAMVDKGYVADRTEAFDRFLSEGGPAYVDRYHTQLEDGIALIRAAGGVAVIAHPWGRGSRAVLGPEELTRLVNDHGLDGFEVDHVDHGPEERAQLRELADSLQVLGTGSSDYHGDGKPGLLLGANTTTPEAYARLRELMDSRAG
ncbi:PHP domain-containing protein [Naumannella sp. ID2617S]|nr:PHP domain-containing protein [Naumannella sp. ID2617S]